MTGISRHLACTLCVVLVLVCSAPAEAGKLETARKLADEGNWAEAAKLYAEVLDKNATDRAAAVGLAKAAIQGNVTDLYHVAEDSLLRLRDKNENDWGVRLALGELSLAIAATKTDTLALKSYHHEAQRNFEAALKGDPTNEDAAAGLARSKFETAFFQEAADVVDQFLAKNPKTTGKALYWKGQAYYFLAQDAFRKGGNKYPLSAEATGFFRKAQGAYFAAAQADNTHYDAWIQYAYASQYLGERKEAEDGYRKAVPLRPESYAPLKGIAALFAHEKDKLALALQKIADENPKHPGVLYYFGKNRYDNKDYAGAIENLEKYVKVAKNPGVGWYYLGKAYQAEVEEEKAVKAYRKALEHNPDDIYSAWELDRRIQDGGAVMKRAASSFKECKRVIAEYEELMKLAPRNASIRNNLAFTLREAYGANKGSSKWLPILKKCRDVYVEASDIIGEWTDERERTWDWAKRYSNAQIISDTGLMFQFYDETRDLKKAEMYYDRALEFTDTGYRDAFNNLSMILAQQERWLELYDLADVAAESIKTEQEQPDTGTRNRAKSIVEKLKDEGKVKD